MGEMGPTYKVRHRTSGTVQDVGEVAWRELEASGDWELVEETTDAAPASAYVEKDPDGKWTVYEADGSPADLPSYARKKDAMAALEAMGVGLTAEEQNEAGEPIEAARNEADEA